MGLVMFHMGFAAFHTDRSFVMPRADKGSADDYIGPYMDLETYRYSFCYDVSELPRHAVTIVPHLQPCS